MQSTTLFEQEEVEPGRSIWPWRQPHRQQQKWIGAIGSWWEEVAEEVEEEEEECKTHCR